MTRTEQVVALVERVKPLFAGKAPEVQAGALADLLAMWLAGHLILDDPVATEKMRAELLDYHLGAVRDLIPVNEREILARITGRSTDRTH
jgi:hypothetical protein